MSVKFLSLLCVLMLVFSCNNNQASTELVKLKPKNTKAVKAKDIAKLRYTDYILDARASDSIANWAAYNQLDGVITDMKKGNLSFFYGNEKAVKELMISLKQTIPLEVNNDAIFARLTALETKVLKLESLANLSTTTKIELLYVIKEFLVAFSNLNLQLNKKIENDNIIIERPENSVIMPI